MTKPMRLGLFQQASPQIGGTLSWPHPRSQSIRFPELDYWIEVAQTIDSAGFDFLFFADAFGYPTYKNDLPAAAVAAGILFPTLDPLFLLPTLAHVTSRLGFVATSTTGLDHPVQAARRFATLDHLTGGRVGWNIVTGGTQRAIADLMGHEEMRKHDDRYEVAGEYVDLALRYLEGSWEDDAVVIDRERRVYAERSKLHRVEFEGKHYRSSGYLTVPPSPQRTPVLFQAGTSSAGQALAAAYAECVFVVASSVESVARSVAEIRAKAEALGRDPHSISIMAGATVIVAADADKAATQRAEFEALQSDEVVNVLYSGNTGIDLMSLDPDKSLAQIIDAGGDIGQIGQSQINRFLDDDGKDAPTVREIMDELRGRGIRGFQLTGDPQDVTDGLESLMDSTGLDGFLIEPVFDLADVRDFAELVVPELRKRGRLPEVPRSGTLRAQLSADGRDRLRSDHPGAKYGRWA